MQYLSTADWHLRPDAPRCRLDKEWGETQRKMMEFIYNYKKDQRDKMLIVGDLYDFSQQPPWVVNLFLETVGDATVFAGNHDFKNRNMNEIENSSIGHVLKNPRYEACIPEFEDGFYMLTMSTLLCHRLVYSPENAALAKFKNGISCDELVEIARKSYSFGKSKKAEWIFIGDNHHHFHYVSEDNIHVVNPGSPLVYKADMIGEECGFYYVDTDTEEVEFVVVPDNSELMTDQYLRDEEVHKEKMLDFVASLDDSEVTTMDFFELNDKKAAGKDKEFLNIYEEIKTETIQMHTKLGKGA